ncbi:hypothetical protein COEREDRAFT_14423 [Coemansia reversa NRRL 1564]|uniref:FAS1 domain-containing protein n=1 Tax=Coemansia reversa (strain ATCC 12441 / NRRL 1564) TaxID=763665 RepID=A0A2G5BF31_COERN|nr:hypothetical protein COEREDRAFT_14423 [Coemansia reversa NRRL 1564]|eukprot:PIA17601.1 hypothetical protein COEREDRAFT_14423 [Coemansia reversa NRRL 1564]
MRLCLTSQAPARWALRLLLLLTPVLLVASKNVAFGTANNRENAAAYITEDTQERPLVTFVDLLSSSERFSEFLHTVQRLRMVLPLNRLTNATMFVPTNEAITRYRREHGYNEAYVAGGVYRGVTDGQAWYHVVGDGAISVQDLVQRTMVWESLSLLGGNANKVHAAQTEHKFGIMLKTQNSGGAVMANGVPVLAQNFSCEAGNVYLVDGLLTIPPSILELLQGTVSTAERVEGLLGASSADPSDMGEYSAVERLFAAAGWTDVLDTAENSNIQSQHDEMHTLWAFGNRAFSSEFSYAERAYLLHGSDFAADDEDLRRDAIDDARAIASRYISRGPTSIARLGMGKHTVQRFGSQANLTVVVSQGKDGVIAHVDGQPIGWPDVIARNGLIHGVEQMHRPDNFALSPQKALVGLNATVFARLLKDAGLGDYIDGSQPDRKLTLLVPTNHAMEDAFGYELGDSAADAVAIASAFSQTLGDSGGDLPSLVEFQYTGQEMDSPREMQREWALYHIVDGQYGVKELAQHPLLRTKLAGEWTHGKAQVVKAEVDPADAAIAKHVSFNGADNILLEPVVVGNTTIYLLTSPMPTPPRLVNALIQNLDLSLFVAAMGASNTVDEIQQKAGVTVLAPVVDAFTSLGLVWSYLSLPGDSDARSDLSRLITAHVLKRPVYSDEIPMHTAESAESLVIEALNGNKVGLYRTPRGIFADIIQTESSFSTHIGRVHSNVAEGLSSMSDEGCLAISQHDILLRTGVAHVLERGLILPSNVDITSAKLLRGMRAHIFVDLLERFNLTYVLKDPRASSEYGEEADALRSSAAVDEGDADGDHEHIIGYSLLVPSDKSWRENMAYRELVHREHDEVISEDGSSDDDGGNPWRNSTTAEITRYMDRLVRLHIVPIVSNDAHVFAVQGPAESDSNKSRRLPANRLLLADRKSYPTLLEDVTLRAHEFANNRFSIQLEGAPFYQSPGGVPFVSVATVVRSGVARTGAVFELDVMLRLPPAQDSGPSGWKQFAWNAAVWVTGIGMGSGLLGITGFWARQWWTRSDYQSL